METSKKKKNIVLFNPIERYRHPQPIVPYALLSISRFIHEEYDVHIIISDMDYNHVNEVIDKCKDATCVGFTALTGSHINDCLYVAKKVREAYPSLTLVWGGWHATIMTEQTLQHPLVDIIVRGQGEYTFCDLVNALDNGFNLSNVLGISYKHKRKVIHNSDRLPENIIQQKGLPYHLINLDQFVYSGSNYGPIKNFGERTIDLLSSIGCPNNCQFCSTPVVYKRRWYPRLPEDVVNDMRYFREQYQIDSVFMRDDNVFVNKKRILELCHLLINAKLNMSIGYADGTAAILSKYTDEEWALLRRAGFKHIFVGVESGDQTTLALMQKKVKLEQFITVAKKGVAYDLSMEFSFIIGTPAKNRKMDANMVYQDIYDNLALMRKMNNVSPNNRFNFVQYFYIPFPGNDLYKISKKAGFEEPRSLEEWGRISTSKRPFGKIPKKLERFANFIEYILLFRLHKDRDGIKNFKDVLRYIFKLIATIRFRTGFFLCSIDFWIYKKWYQFSKRNIVSVDTPPYAGDDEYINS